MLNENSKKKDFIYLLGLHRPYNMSLKGVTWVCSFIKRNEDRTISIAPSHFYVEFYRFHIKQILKHPSKDDNEQQGVISANKALVAQKWILQRKNTLEIENDISKILQKRNDKIDQTVYSTYKNTSYYITLAKKLNYIDANYKLTSFGYALVEASNRFYKLSKKEQESFFLRIVEHDGDIFLPLLFSLYFKNKYFNEKYFNERRALHLVYLDQCLKVNYFEYVEKSQSKNYDKVRLKWIEDLDVVNAYSKIRKRYVELLESSSLKRKYSFYNDAAISFINTYVKVAKNDDEFKITLESEYQKMCALGKSDLDFVNLYELKSQMRMSFSKFERLLNNYYNYYSKEKPILFSNIVSSVDARKRFIIKGTPVIKIRIISNDKK